MPNNNLKIVLSSNINKMTIKKKKEKIVYKSLQISKYYSFQNIQNNSEFIRSVKNKEQKHCKRGVYFWGFNLLDNPEEVPKTKNDIILYYIGKSSRNISERIMQEITQSIFGGFGTIISPEYLKENLFKARLINQQESLEHPNFNSIVLYKSYGLHVLNKFIIESKNPEHDLYKALKWMRERLFFVYIETDEDPKDLESELHKIVRTNIFGVGNMKKLVKKQNLDDTDLYFQQSNLWGEHTYLKDWFIEVNKNIPDDIIKGQEVFYVKDVCSIEKQCCYCPKKIKVGTNYYMYKNKLEDQQPNKYFCKKSHIKDYINKNEGPNASDK